MNKLLSFAKEGLQLAALLGLRIDKKCKYIYTILKINTCHPEFIPINMKICPLAQQFSRFTSYSSKTDIICRLQCACFPGNWPHSWGVCRPLAGGQLEQGKLAPPAWGRARGKWNSKRVYVIFIKRTNDYLRQYFLETNRAQCIQRFLLAWLPKFNIFNYKNIYD